MIDRRIVFSKTGRAKYISHLDLMRAFARAFTRCGLPVWYTEGFNPHIYMTFALPLSLGCESLVETVDFRLTEELSCAAVAQRLDAVMPEGLQILSAAAPVHRADEIRFCEYSLRWACKNASDYARGYADFCAQEQIPILKKTKRSEKMIDLRPLFTPLDAKQEDGSFTATVRLASGVQTNISTTLLLAAMQPFLPDDPDDILHLCRTAVLLEDGQPFC